MEIFTFASNNLTNIWAGIGARLWAVSHTENPTTAKVRKTKSQNMRVGSFGILHCNETQALTTPFIVYSKPDLNRVVANVWPEKWVLPFRIFPLGSPEWQMGKDEAKEILPVFKKSREANFGNIFHVQAVTAFSATKIELEDWEVLMGRLAIKTVDASNV